MKPCLMLFGSLDGRGVWGRKDTSICVAESLCCSPETITILLIVYTPIQNHEVSHSLLNLFFPQPNSFLSFCEVSV